MQKPSFQLVRVKGTVCLFGRNKLTACYRGDSWNAPQLLRLAASFFKS